MATDLTSEEIIRGSALRLRRRLSEICEFKTIDDYRARMAVGDREADVHFEPYDWVSVSLQIDDPVAPIAALEAASNLAGNVRYAQEAGSLKIVADTKIDGEAHLPESMDEIRSGFLDAIEGGADGPARDDDTLESKAVELALSELKDKDEYCVRRDGGWELRPRIGEHVLPVQVAITGARLRVHRAVTKKPADEKVAAAVADQSLRFNGQVRFARLAFAGSELVVETQLHRGLIESAWLVTAAQAVSSACHHVQVVLETLAEQKEVSNWYSAALLGNEE